MRYIQETKITTPKENVEYMEQTKIFQEVYPFTTESIAGYFPNLNLNGKSLLTVGSSLDQAYNALVLGAEEITVLDVNAYTEPFHKVKSHIIQSTPREKLYQKVLDNKQVPYSKDIFSKNTIKNCNLYLQNDKNYKLLREKLSEDRITFVNGDIFDMDTAIEDKTYDRIVFSNILQYLEFLATPEDPYQYLSKGFENWKKHLNNDGILQLLYLYSLRREDIKNVESTLAAYNLRKIVETLKGNSLELEWIPGIADKEDAIVTYTKKRR